MKLYLLDLPGVPPTWTGTQEDAKSQAKHHGGQWSPREVPTDKPGLIAFLNELEDIGSIPDRDPDVAAGRAPPSPPTLPEQSGYAERSVTIDDAWEALPLARKLHFAALAMEEARGKVQ